MRNNPPRNTVIRYDGESATYQYVGEAPVGANESDAVWRIFRLTTSGSNLSKDWADGSDLFNKSWSNRASYNY